MKKLSFKIAALIILLATACEKDEITPSKPNLKEKGIDCKGCMGQWDLIDTIP